MGCPFFFVASLFPWFQGKTFCEDIRTSIASNCRIWPATIRANTNAELLTLPVSLASRSGRKHKFWFGFSSQSQLQVRQARSPILQSNRSNDLLLHYNEPASLECDIAAEPSPVIIWQVWKRLHRRLGWRTASHTHQEFSEKMKKCSTSKELALMTRASLAALR